MNIFVSDHALERWRQRAAAYADAGRDDVRQAFQEARRLQDDDFLPIPRAPDRVYHHHAATGTYFVAHPLSRDTVQIVTIIAPDTLTSECGPPVKRQRLAPRRERQLLKAYYNNKHTILSDLRDSCGLLFGTFNQPHL